jgi:thymidylate kinase
LALKDLSKYSNYEVLKSKIDLLISSWKIILPDFIFFLKTNPNIAKERINDRFWETKHFFKDEKTLNSLYNNLFSIITDNNLLKNIEYEIIENNWKDDLAKVIEYVSNKFIDIIKK